MRKHFIQLSEANCRNCMRCVRICPTKAMTYVDHQPVIKEDECILCGDCYTICPHFAKKVYSDLDLLKIWLQEGQDVIVSLAPSFVLVWPNLKKLTDILKGIGFYKVEETAIGAAMVSKTYSKLVSENEMDNIITTCCPAIVSLVEKYYPDLINYLAPVVSPLIAHGKKIRFENPEAKIIFLTPCIAKQKEIEKEEFKGLIDACINIDEFNQYLQELGYDRVEFSSDYNQMNDDIARNYPYPGGILKTIATDNNNYIYLNVEGVKQAKEVLKMISEQKLDGYFIEMSACIGSCLNGPLLENYQGNKLKALQYLNSQVKGSHALTYEAQDFDLSFNFSADNIIRFKHDESAISDILFLMGKTSIDKELNCGMCGYETCREKAIAVLDNKADINLCLPNALEKAESISNRIIENTPNGIVVIDDKYLIKEINPSAKHLLNIDSINPKNMPLNSLIVDDDLIAVIDKNEKIQYYENRYDDLHLSLEFAIISLFELDLKIIIIMDKTVDEIKDAMIKELKIKTYKVTQNVIEEQMRTVQEIASLLGETTAKSKIALNDLLKVINDE